MLQRLKLEIWKSIHSLPSGLIHIWQLLALQRLARHAYANTALYRDLWDKRGVKPSHLKRLSDLQRFPIINKKIFLAAPGESYIGMAEQTFHMWRSTSGTSGEPFSFICINSRPRFRRSPYVDFLDYRFLYWEEISPDIIQKKIPLVRISAVTKKTYSQYQWRLNMPINELLKNTRGALEEIFRIQPTVIESYPSILVELAQAVIRVPQFKQLGVKYAFSYGENMKPSQRIFIEDTLGCKVIDHYGLAEFGSVATECKKHRGLHSSAESFYVEIVDDKGFLVPRGKRGRIIITDLRNFVMPFIRYDTGDQGYFLPGRCLCGLEGEQFVVEGRVGEFLTLGFTKVHHLEFDKIMDSFSGAIVQYQVMKVDEQTVTLSIIRGQAMTEFILEHIREHMQSLIGANNHLNVSFVTEMKRAPQGKCQTLISK